MHDQQEHQSIESNFVPEKETIATQIKDELVKISVASKDLVFNQILKESRVSVPEDEKLPLTNGQLIFTVIADEIYAAIKENLNESEETELKLAGLVPTLSGVNMDLQQNDLVADFQEIGGEIDKKDKEKETWELAKKETSELLESWQWAGVKAQHQTATVTKSSFAPEFSISCLKVGTNIDVSPDTINETIAFFLNSRSVLGLTEADDLSDMTIIEVSEVINAVDPDVAAVEREKIPFSEPDYKTLTRDLITKIYAHGLVRILPNGHRVMLIPNRARIQTIPGIENPEGVIDQGEKSYILAHESTHLADPYLTAATPMLREGFATANQYYFSFENTKQEYRDKTKREITYPLLKSFFGTGANGSETNYTPGIHEIYQLSAAFFSFIHQELGEEGVSEFYKYMVKGFYFPEEDAYYGKNDLDYALIWLRPLLPDEYDDDPKKFIQKFLNLMNQ